MAQITTLFTVTLAVLVLLGAAFHWQAAKAAEADRTLSVATERLDKALDRGHCGLWDWDIARGRIFWSKSMFDILGLEPTGRVPELWRGGRAHPSRRCPDRALVEDAARRQASFDQEFRMRHRTAIGCGSGPAPSLRARRAKQAPHLVGIAIDVTAQKLADRLNQEAELRLKDAIENISEAFVLWDADNQLVLCNSKYQQFHACRPASACRARPMRTWRGPAKEPAVRQRMPLAGGEPPRAIPSRCSWATAAGCRSTSGAPRTAASSRSAPTSRRSSSRRSGCSISERELMMTVRDLQKDRGCAEQQSQRLADLADKYAREKTRAEAANRSKSEFLANMSHELGRRSTPSSASAR